MKDDRKPDELVFSSIPKHLDVHSYRREYAQALYLCYAPGWALPPSEGRLRSSAYNAEAVQAVSRALGHNRKDVVINHYIR
ncbi:MAG: integrase, partial [Chloroflexota bacterium]|nr:integrase [Chloroflexota bacterium]